MRLAIKEKAALYAAYIPFFSEGGIFVPTQREYRLGDDVYVLLTLPEDTQRYPVAGRVAWVTPARAAGNRTQGIGIQFPKDDKSRVLKARIEEILARPWPPSGRRRLSEPFRFRPRRPGRGGRRRSCRLRGPAPTVISFPGRNPAVPPFSYGRGAPRRLTSLLPCSPIPTAT